MILNRIKFTSLLILRLKNCKKFGQVLGIVGGDSFEKKEKEKKAPEILTFYKSCFFQIPMKNDLLRRRSRFWKKKCLPCFSQKLDTRPNISQFQRFYWPHTILGSTAFEALKLWNVRSGEATLDVRVWHLAFALGLSNSRGRGQRFCINCVHLPDRTFHELRAPKSVNCYVFQIRRSADWIALKPGNIWLGS